MSAVQTDQLGSEHFGRDDGGPTLVIAHGILGSRRNWRTFARKLSAQRPDCSIWTVDLRAHGDSRALRGDDTLAACADDIVAQFSAAKEVVLVGHSFGGKVMCAAAAKWPRPLRQLWVLDSALGDREASFGGGAAEVEGVLRAALAVPIDSLD
ncbi:MAG TPA: hypothetical protein DCQ06_12370, partial [Myxococcales bacterium]|nr:hypothetical protein [Myxococcales bacterium]